MTPPESSSRIGPRNTTHWNVVAMSRSLAIARIVPVLIILGIVCVLACLPVLAAQAVPDRTVDIHADSTVIPVWVAVSIVVAACGLVGSLVWFLSQLTGGVNVRLVAIESEVKHMRRDIDILSHRGNGLEDCHGTY